MTRSGSFAALSMIAWSAENVGTRATSLSLITLIVFVSRSVQCSIESIPAWAAIRIPSAPCACVVMRIPALCASSTAARVSSRVYCVRLGPAPSPRTPPVEKNLMTPQPAAICSRVARRTSSGPSATRPISVPWPPVFVTPRPAATIRGPSTVPASIARPSSMTIVPFAPRSRTVVTPARSAARAFANAFSVATDSLCRASFSKSAVPSSVRWAWQLIMPGIAKRAAASNVRERSPFGVFGARERLPTQTTSPSSMTIAASDVVVVPSKRPSTSRTVRIAAQYRPAMPRALADRLRARGAVMPDYTGRGLLNVPATVLDIFGARTGEDPPPLAELDAALLKDVRRVVVILADGLGMFQLEKLCQSGATPFFAKLIERARRGEAAQLLDCTTVFPSTTAAAITTMHTARTPQEHGNIAYFVWLDEFEQVPAMLRGGPAITRRGSYFDDAKLDPRDYVKAPSIHTRLRERDVATYLIEPEIFRNEPMKRMHAREASYVGYQLPTTMGV